MSSRPAVAFSLTLASLLALASATVANAEQKPLWELGLGLGVVTFPDYRGSDETQVLPVPVPYFVYRGDFFKADRDGVRGELFDREYAELTVSAAASVPVKSEDNAARRGMPDLRPTLELGPSLDLHVWKSPDERYKLDVVVPVRLPFTVESSPRSIGYVFTPRVNLDVENVAGQAGWNLGLGVGVEFAHRKFNQYFYSVAPSDATPDRPAYQADGGYSGMNFLASLSKKFPDFWVGAFMSYGALRGAEFEDSPLVRSKHSLSGGIGFAWMIRESSTLVETEE